MTKKKNIPVLVMLAALALPIAAAAADGPGKSARDFMIRGRLIGVIPDVDLDPWIIGVGVE